MQINQTMTPTQISEPARFDRRIVRTQNLLAHALIELTLEHGYEAITIREITERAKVGYATFFRHYSDKEALLNDVLALFIEELTQRLSSSIGEDDFARQGELIFAYVQQHSALSRLLLTSRSRGEVMKAIQLNQHFLSQAQSKTQSTDTIPVEVALYHWSAATISLIEWWLENEMNLSPQRMGEIYRDLIVLPTVKVMTGAS